MNWIIRNVRILKPGSPLHNQIRDIGICDGRLSHVSEQPLSLEGKEINIPALCISPGWLDLQAEFGDPGFEARETVVSGLDTAAAGGYTHVCVMPQAHPPADRSSSVRYLLERGAGHTVRLLPAAALSMGLEGKEMAELQDMGAAGAVMFTDGVCPLGKIELLERALRYTSAFGGLVADFPQEPGLSRNAQLHEGPLSTKWGLSGWPEAAELIQTERDIRLQRYTGGKLHLFNLSLPEAADLVGAAGQSMEQLSASVSVFHLCFEDKHAVPFETAFKFAPPLRPAAKRKGLIEALIAGKIHAVSSQHSPMEDDLKACEFDKAGFGSISLQTVYSLLCSVPELMARHELFPLWLSVNPRKILGLEVPDFAVGESADYTIFCPESSWEFNARTNRSLSCNSPVFGRELRGKVMGVFRENYFHIND